MQTNSHNQSPRDLVQLAAQILHCGSNSENVAQYCEDTLRILVDHAHVSTAVIAYADQGVWRTVASVGTRGAPENDLLADAADREHPCQDRQWWAIPLRSQKDGTWVLAVRHIEMDVDVTMELKRLASLVGDTLAVVLRLQDVEARWQHLDSILRILTHWYSQSDGGELLRDIANSCRILFSARRAAVYLWDRKRSVLVGTVSPPSEGSATIVIPDQNDTVGRAIRTGLVVRAAITNEHPASLASANAPAEGELSESLCVPIQGRRGRVLGAVELQLGSPGSFDSEHEGRLVELARHAAIAMQNNRLDRESLAVNPRYGEEPVRVELIGDSQPIRGLREKVLRVAASELPVLLLGENGSGKEVVSRMIHENGVRRDKPFLAVNCAALAESLLETELFGHEKGAYTDAHEKRSGKFEAATDGTLFLDEIGELSPRAQAQLLRVLDEKSFTRVGGTDIVSTNARLIAATNRDLARMVQENTFREDLFFRLNVVTLELPPLREHAEDVVLLAHHFLAHFAKQVNRSIPHLTESAKRLLRDYHWPGNVRELRNLMERSTYLCPSEQLDAADLEGLMQARGSESQISLELTLADATREFQVQYIQQQINAAGGNMSEAARRLGLHRSNLYRKMRQLDMPADEE